MLTRERTRDMKVPFDRAQVRPVRRAGIEASPHPNNAAILGPHAKSRGKPRSIPGEATPVSLRKLKQAVEPFADTPLFPSATPHGCPFRIVWARAWMEESRQARESEKRPARSNANQTATQHVLAILYQSNSNKKMRATFSCDDVGTSDVETGRPHQRDSLVSAWLHAGKREAP